MPASDVLEAELLELLFHNAAFDNIGDATGIGGSASAGNVELTIHTGTLVDASTQSTSEADYLGYTRQDVARSTAQWSRTGNTMSNDNVIQFGQKTGGATDVVTDFGIGSDVIAQELWIYGALAASLSVTSGVNPQFAANDLDISVGSA